MFEFVLSGGGDVACGPLRSVIPSLSFSFQFSHICVTLTRTMQINLGRIWGLRNWGLRIGGHRREAAFKLLDK